MPRIVVVGSYNRDLSFVMPHMPAEGETLIGADLVEGPGGKIYPYIIIGLIEKRRRAGDYASWIRSRADIIRHVSSIVYKGITRHHDFGNEL